MNMQCPIVVSPPSSAANASRPALPALPDDMLGAIARALNSLDVFSCANSSRAMRSALDPTQPHARPLLAALRQSTASVLDLGEGTPVGAPACPAEFLTPERQFADGVLARSGIPEGPTELLVPACEPQETPAEFMVRARADVARVGELFALALVGPESRYPLSMELANEAPEIACRHADTIYLAAYVLTQNGPTERPVVPGTGVRVSCPELSGVLHGLRQRWTEGQAPRAQSWARLAEALAARTCTTALQACLEDPSPQVAWRVLELDRQAPFVGPRAKPCDADKLKVWKYRLAQLVRAAEAQLAASPESDPAAPNAAEDARHAAALAVRRVVLEAVAQTSLTYRNAFAARLSRRND